MIKRIGLFLLLTLLNSSAFSDIGDAKVRLIEDKNFKHQVQVLQPNQFNEKGVFRVLNHETQTEDLVPFRLKETDGKTVTIMKPPAAIQLHAEGFFYTLVVGSNLLVASHRFSEPEDVIIDKIAIGLVRSGEAKVELSSEAALVVRSQSETRFGVDGLRLTGALTFHEFTADNVTALVNRFGAIDMVQQASRGALEPNESYSAYLKNTIRIMGLPQSACPLVVDSHPGVEGKSVVHLLAKKIAQGAFHLRGSSDWKLFEVSWTKFNTQGEVNKTVQLVNELFQIVKQKRVILFFPDIHQLKGLGVDKGDNAQDATSAMKNALASGEVLVIGSTTNQKYTELSYSASEFVGAFSKVVVAVPTPAAAEEFLAQYVSQQEKNHKVKLAPVVADVITLTNQFIPEEMEAQPGKAKEVLSKLASRPDAYLPEGARLQTEDGIVLITYDMVKKAVAEKTGIETLGQTESDKGLKHFISDEVFWPAMNKKLIGMHDAKQSVLNGLTLLADESAKSSEADGSETGIHTTLLLGPSGTGKSEIALSLQKALAADSVRWNVFQLELGKMKRPDSIASIIGANPGFIGYEQNGGKFLSFLRENKQGILVIEEMDKAHPEVIHSLYEFLDKGKFQDAGLNSVRWTRGLAFITSNFGAQGALKELRVDDEGRTYWASPPGTSNLIDEWDRWHLFKKEPENQAVKQMTEEQLKTTLLKELQETQKISEQIIGRIGKNNIIIVHHFTEEQFRQLLDIFLNKASSDLKQSQQLEVEFTPAAREWLFETAWGPEGENSFKVGARALIDVIKDSVSVPLVRAKWSKAVAERQPEQNTLIYDIKDGRPHVTLKPLAKPKAEEKKVESRAANA